MAAPSTTDELLAQVRALGLCDQAVLTGRFPADTPLPASPAECVRQLVSGGVCTRYQGKMLLAGKGRRLVLGNYRLLRPLGRGGAGSVFLAEHMTVKRRVAVKVLRGAGSDSLATARFQREGRAAAALDHPNIVRLFDFGVSHGVHYLVMEYLPGVTVQQLLDTSGPLAVPTAVYLVTQTAYGLAHAHARGIVHRDVKPLNLMAGDGGVKVLDMGLARALDSGDDRLTEQAGDDAICGTLDYLSPEQCSGGAVDARTDIYSLGVTLFTLLAGRPPFPGSPAEKIAQHQTATPPPLDRVVPAVPPGLARLVERMMAKRPDDRPPTCEAVIEGLAPWCPADPPHLPGSDPGRTTSLRISRTQSQNWSAGEINPPASRRRRWGWAVAGLVVVGVLGGVNWAMIGRSAAPVTRVPDPWAGECLWLKGSDAPVNDLAFTPDGRYLVGVDWNGRLHVWDAVTGSLRHSITLKPDSRGLACSVGASGRVYAAGLDMGVFVVDPECGEVKRVIDTPHPRLWTVQPTADERRLLLAGEGGVEVWDVKTATRLTTYPTTGEYVWVAAFSPDESVIAAGGRTGEEFDGPGVIHLWETATGAERLTLKGHDKPVRTIAFSPDGHTLYSGSFDGTVRVWDTTTGECLRVIEAHPGYIERVVPAGGGRLLTVAGPPQDGAGLFPLVKLWDADGKELSGGPPHDDRHLYAGAVSADRTRFAAAAHSNTVRLWVFRPPPD